METGCNRWIYPNWQDEMKAKLRSQGDASSAWVSIERAAWSTERKMGRWVCCSKGLHFASGLRWVKSDGYATFAFSFFRHLAAETSIRRDTTFFFGGFVRAQVRCTSSFYRCSFFISGWSLKKLWSPVASSQCIFVNHGFALDLFEKYENSHVLQSFSSQASTHVCGQYDSGIFGNLAFLWPEKHCSFVTHCLLVNAP